MACFWSKVQCHEWKKLCILNEIGNKHLAAARSMIKAIIIFAHVSNLLICQTKVTYIDYKIFILVKFKERKNDKLQNFEIIFVKSR